MGFRNVSKSRIWSLAIYLPKRYLAPHPGRAVGSNGGLSTTPPQRPSPRLHLQTRLCVGRGTQGPAHTQTGPAPQLPNGTCEAGPRAGWPPEGHCHPRGASGVAPAPQDFFLPREPLSSRQATDCPLRPLPGQTRLHDNPHTRAARPGSPTTHLRGVLWVRGLRQLVGARDSRLVMDDPPGPRRPHSGQSTGTTSQGRDLAPAATGGDTFCYMDLNPLSWERPLP